MSADGAGRDPHASRPARAARPLETPERDEGSAPRWVLPLIAITTLTLGGWYIIQNLAANSKMEDCTMSGRRNCVPPIDTSNMK
jgi:hypothetical protein